MDLDGIILVDKDEGFTSFDVVAIVKRRLSVHKAGHTGTLDKGASGLLIVCVNRATSIQSLLMTHYKRYRATIAFGIETDTLDRNGRIVKTERVERFTDHTLHSVLRGFRGKTEQIPPAFSAIHLNGKRMYQRAVNGEEFCIQPRDIDIKELRLMKNEGKSITIDAVVSKGTYIRSLARDIAYKLGTCGHVSSLRRLAVGPFSIEDALKTEEIGEDTDILSLNQALVYLPRIAVNDKVVKKIGNGVPPQKIFSDHEHLFKKGGYFRVVFGRELIAILEKNKKLQYFKVFKGS